MKIINGDWYNIESDIARFDKYQCILADCPWLYNDQSKIRKDGATPTKGIGACNHYPGIPTDDLARFNVGEQLGTNRSMLWLWATEPMLLHALRVMAAWGFEYVTIGFTWIKLNKAAWKDSALWEMGLREAAGMLSQPDPERIRQVLNSLTVAGPGYYTMSNPEHLLIGRRGRAFRHAEKLKARQVVYWPLLSHSEKPDIFQDLIEMMYPKVTPRLELFARRSKDGWDSFGNELGGLR